MYLHAVFALIALLIGCGELDRTKGRGSVRPYAGVGDQSADYSVAVEGQNVAVNAWSHAGRIAHYAHFEFTGTVTIEITNKLGDFGSASISPKRFSISPTISGSKAIFTLSTPRKLVIYAGETRLFIFAEGPQTTPSQSDLAPRHTQHRLRAKLRWGDSPHFHERPPHVSFKPPEGGEDGRSWNLSTGRHL